MASPLTTDELTLHLVATGIIALTQRAAQGEAVYPYPEALQRGLDRLTVAALRHQIAPPQGVPASSPVSPKMGRLTLSGRDVPLKQ